MHWVRKVTRNRLEVNGSLDVNLLSFLFHFSLPVYLSRSDVIELEVISLTRLIHHGIDFHSSLCKNAFDHVGNYFPSNSVSDWKVIFHFFGTYVIPSHVCGTLGSISCSKGKVYPVLSRAIRLKLYREAVEACSLAGFHVRDETLDPDRRIAGISH